MEFVHQHHCHEDTIAAIATPMGEGGVAIVRLSGNCAIGIADAMFSGPVLEYISHTVHYGKIIDFDGDIIDDVLLLVMLGKRSYTGNDTVEIHCHGGTLISRLVLSAALKHGARAAGPGEFTFRSFMNGKIDLVQAEAVQSIIAAKNELALQAAGNHLQGALSKKIIRFQRKLVDSAAIIEAWVDFPEEDLEFASFEDMCGQLNDVRDEMVELVDTFHNGKIACDGVSMCLVGSPNVGKSLLMNTLLGKDRAIVTHIPGTTRDIIEDDLAINGLKFRIIDTAGIRDNPEIIEEEGIRRTREVMRYADIVLCILDVSKGIGENEKALLRDLPKGNTVIVWNKIDLPYDDLPVVEFDNCVSLSAKEKIGIDKLCDVIDTVVWKGGAPKKGEVVITSLRHKEALNRSIVACSNVISGLGSGGAPEIVSIDMRECLNELGTIIGTNISDDILSSIFSKFCVGK